MTLLENITASNLDSPTKRYISCLTSLSENLQARYTASELQFDEISKIVKREHNIRQGNE
jgi:hypothetical protein